MNEEKPDAYVTLVATDNYVQGAIVLAYSLRNLNTTKLLVCLVTPSLSYDNLTQLQKLYDQVIHIDQLDTFDKASLSLLGRPELGLTVTKIQLWSLHWLRTCLFLDADTLVLKSLDHLFDQYKFIKFAACPDPGWPDCFNSGVFICKPNLKVYQDLIKLLHSEGSFDGGDQGLLNSYFDTWSTDSNQRLPFIYNVTPNSVYSYAPALKKNKDEIAVVHFVGKDKPWHQNQVDPYHQQDQPYSHHQQEHSHHKAQDPSHYQNDDHQQEHSHHRAQDPSHYQNDDHQYEAQQPSHVRHQNSHLPTDHHESNDQSRHHDVSKIHSKEPYFKLNNLEKFEGESNLIQHEELKQNEPKVNNQEFISKWWKVYNQSLDSLSISKDQFTSQTKVNNTTSDEKIEALGLSHSQSDNNQTSNHDQHQPQLETNQQPNLAPPPIHQLDNAFYNKRNQHIRSHQSAVNEQKDYGGDPMRFEHPMMPSSVVDSLKQNDMLTSAHSGAVGEGLPFPLFMAFKQHQKQHHHQQLEQRQHKQYNHHHHEGRYRQHDNHHRHESQNEIYHEQHHQKQQHVHHYAGHNQHHEQHHHYKHQQQHEPQHEHHYHHKYQKYNKHNQHHEQQFDHGQSHQQQHHHEQRHQDTHHSKPQKVRFEVGSDDSDYQSDKDNHYRQNNQNPHQYQTHVTEPRAHQDRFEHHSQLKNPNLAIIDKKEEIQDSSRYNDSEVNRECSKKLDNKKSISGSRSSSFYRSPSIASGQKLATTILKNQSTHNSSAPVTTQHKSIFRTQPNPTPDLDFIIAGRRAKHRTALERVELADDWQDLPIDILPTTTPSWPLLDQPPHPPSVIRKKVEPGVAWQTKLTCSADKPTLSEDGSYITIFTLIWESASSGGDGVGIDIPSPIMDREGVESEINWEVREDTESKSDLDKDEAGIGFNSKVKKVEDRTNMPHLDIIELAHSSMNSKSEVFNAFTSNAIQPTSRVGNVGLSEFKKDDDLSLVRSKGKQNSNSIKLEEEIDLAIDKAVKDKERIELKAGYKTPDSKTFVSAEELSKNGSKELVRPAGKSFSSDSASKPIIDTHQILLTSQSPTLNQLGSVINQPIKITNSLAQTAGWADIKLQSTENVDSQLQSIKTINSPSQSAKIKNPRPILTEYTSSQSQEVKSTNPQHQTVKKMNPQPQTTKDSHSQSQGAKSMNSQYKYRSQSQPMDFGNYRIGWNHPELVGYQPPATIEDLQPLAYKEVEDPHDVKLRRKSISRSGSSWELKELGLSASKEEEKGKSIEKIKESKDADKEKKKKSKEVSIGEKKKENEEMNTDEKKEEGMGVKGNARLAGSNKLGDKDHKFEIGLSTPSVLVNSTPPQVPIDTNIISRSNPIQPTRSEFPNFDPNQSIPIYSDIHYSNFDETAGRHDDISVDEAGNTLNTEPGTMHFDKIINDGDKKASQEEISADIENNELTSLLRTHPSSADIGRLAQMETSKEKKQVESEVIGLANEELRSNIFDLSYTQRQPPRAILELIDDKSNNEKKETTTDSASQLILSPISNLPVGVELSSTVPTPTLTSSPSSITEYQMHTPTIKLTPTQSKAGSVKSKEGDKAKPVLINHLF